MRRWSALCWLGVALAPCSLAQNPRWIMGKGNSFTHLEERLGGRDQLIARRIRAVAKAAPESPRVADAADPAAAPGPTRVRAGIRTFDSRLIPTVFACPVPMPSGVFPGLAPGAPGR
jgi:hypothetical protein